VRRSISLALAGVLACAATRPARGQAVIEGTVTLSRATIAPVSTPRYPVSASYTIGPPDPPVAVVWL